MRTTKIPASIQKLLLADTRAAKALATSILQAAEALENPAAVDHKADAIRRIHECIAANPNESFCGAVYDNAKRFLGMFHAAEGSKTRTVIYPRRLAERVLQLGGTCVVLAHNHPSGIVTPSLEDRRMDARLRDLMGSLEITVQSVVITATDHHWFE